MKLTYFPDTDLYTCNIHLVDRPGTKSQVLKTLIIDFDNEGRSVGITGRL